MHVGCTLGIEWRLVRYSWSDSVKPIDCATASINPVLIPELKSDPEVAPYP